MASGILLMTQESVGTVAHDDATALYANGALAVDSVGGIYRYWLAGAGIAATNPCKVSSTTAVIPTAGGANAGLEQICGYWLTAVTNAQYGFGLVYGHVASVAHAGTTTIVGAGVGSSATALKVDKYIPTTAGCIAGPCGWSEAIVASGASGAVHMACM